MTKDSELVGYLDDLLDSDNHEQLEDIDNSSLATNKQEALVESESDYKIYTFPAKKIVTTPSNGIDTNQPIQDERYKIERMERLLDDFNRREEHKTSVEAESFIEHQADDKNAKTTIGADSFEHPAAYTEAVYVNGILQPAWAAEEFEVVIVEAVGLRIAVPLFSLAGIQSLAESKLDTETRPKNSALFIGTAEFNHIHYPVIDSCRWFMPEQYADIAHNSIEYEYYLTHTKSHFALAVNAVHTSIKLHKDDVKWAKAQSKRPWLAGMLKEQRAILVELDMLMKYFAEFLH